MREDYTAVFLLPGEGYVTLKLKIENGSESWITVQELEKKMEVLATHLGCEFLTFEETS